jgi:uncharacterized caspase-like protein/tetratricopeptide (TPR) repeat protein
MKKTAARILVIIFLTLAVGFLFPARHVSAQDELRREIRQRDKSARVGVTRDETAARDAQEPTLWAVIIGVSRYTYGDRGDDGEIPNLHYAEADARELYNFLRSPEGGGFRDKGEGGHLTLLTDEDATKASVDRALTELKQTKPNDYFVIFVAAHGMVIPQLDPATKTTTEVPYFAFHDTDLGNVNDTAIRMDAFQNLIKEIPARKGVVLADTCHSAGVQVAGRATSSNMRANATFIDKMKDSAEGVGFIWSASQTETAGEPKSLGHGYFTATLLEGLAGNADRDNDGKVTFKELADFVLEEVPKLTGNKQHPYYSISNKRAQEMPLAVVPYADAESDATQFGTLVIRTPDIKDVQVSIDGEYLPDKLDPQLQRSVRVRPGTRNLSFYRGGKRTDIQAEVTPRKSKLVEVNLAFSQSNSAEDSLLDAPKGVLNVYLTEDKEPSKEAKELLQKGVDSFKKRKFEEAVAQLKQAIQANAGAYADAYVFLGRAQQTLGRLKDAVDSYERARALKPSDYETETLLAETKFVSGNFNVDDIIKDLERIKYRHPQYDYVRVVLADVLMATRHDYWGAERELRLAISAQPNSPPAHMILSQALTKQRSAIKQKQAVEEGQLAIDLFDRLSQKQVSFARGLKRLSISHVIFGGGRYLDYAAMREAHRTLAEACILLWDLDESLADRNVYLDRARQSITQATGFSQKDKDNAGLAMVLDVSAQIYVRKLDLTRAIKEAEQALTIADADDIKGELHYTLYTAYKAAQKYGKAVESLQKYLALEGSLLSTRDRQDLEGELAVLNRLKEANRQK